MKVSGGQDLKVHGDETHVRQTPGPQANWQDSVVLVWWDEANGIGGFHRIGHEPNYAGGGRIALWNNLMSPQGVYKNTQFKPLREADKLASGGHGGGDETCRCEYLDGQHVWTIEDGDVSARLSLKDVGFNVDCYPKKGSLSEEFAAAHFDVPGTVTGWLKIKGKQYQVDGLGIRDHGWGARDWSSMYSHRWVAGTCGSELSFIAVAWHSVDENIASFGWVIRGDTITFAKKLDVLAYIEMDGVTNRGGHVQFTLTTGEVLDIECKPLPAKAVASYHHDICCIDMMCTWECNGLHGICDFESTANIQHGKRVPKKFSNTIIDNGFHAD